MKQLLILFIFFAFTKENISYKRNKVYSYNLNCIQIEEFLNFQYPPEIDDYPLNAQYCRLNDQNITELENMGKQTTADKPTTDPIPTPKINPDSQAQRRLRNLEDSQSNRDKCCYISVLPKTDNSEWLYFCGQVNSTIEESKISKYVEQIKERDDFKNNYKDIKIDCFSQKFDFMINALLISLIFLI